MLFTQYCFMYDKILYHKNITLNINVKDTLPC